MKYYFVRSVTFASNRSDIGRMHYSSILECDIDSPVEALKEIKEQLKKKYLRYTEQRYVLQEEYIITEIEQFNNVI